MSDKFDWFECARSHMTPNYAPPPMLLVKGQGTQVWDHTGKGYLDFAGGIGVLAIGHSHPRVVRAINDQAQKLSHTSNLFYHENYIRLCQKLAELSFGNNVFLTNSGTEAIEASLKLARRFFYEKGETNRTHFVAAEAAFHGRSYGSLSITGQAKLQEGFTPLLPNVRHVPYNDATSLQNNVDENTAAVILEPIQGNGGVRIPSADYFSRVREICDRTGTLLILDEVQTGIGRTGKWFAYQHENIRPDIMALAKMLGGGLPLGAMVSTSDIVAALKPGSHASTYGGNPIACAAGLATLEIIEEEMLLKHAHQQGLKLSQGLKTLGQNFAVVQEIRGRGLMIGMVLERPAKDLFLRCVELGLLCTVAGGTTLRLLPPLNVRDVEIDQALSIIEQALQTTH